ncbi:tyrosine-type recombinase/integrase [Catellatospora tritici]|uniref:tyrosine-type recombinase/integrase n=1 Tax=Catellatospora tritici TaxID=2851566 RepID=UPI0020C49A40|nr:site-specific integrase [Catellatospora tritici]
MAATIYQGNDGRWHGRVTMGTLDNGKPDRRHVGAKTEAEVIQKVRALERDRDAGRTKRPGRAGTVEQWLLHWLENIAAPNIRPSTLASYESAVHRHLIPSLGAHRTDRLQPEHIEKMYAKLRAAKLKPSTIYQVHRIFRVALNEAVRRGQIINNPVLMAKAPRLVEDEIEPLTTEEARRVMAEAATRRNGVRFALALALGLRQGEALGLQWCDLDATAGTLTVRRAIQRQVWRHGCAGKCGERRGADCPRRHGGGLVVTDTKSRKGRRTVGLPGPLLAALLEHQAAQAKEREIACDLWQEGGWMFAQATGKPTDPRADYKEWKELLKAAKVRPARLHDARHTAATMLLVLNVPTRAVMDVMGWSQASIAARYQHVPAEVLRGIADQVGGLLWSGPPDSPEGPTSGSTETETETARSDTPSSGAI